MNNTYLSSLDLSNNIFLNQLWCRDNDSLTDLDLRNINLINLSHDISGNNNLNCISVDNISANDNFGFCVDYEINLSGEE